MTQRIWWLCYWLAWILWALVAVVVLTAGDAMAEDFYDIQRHHQIDVLRNEQHRQRMEIDRQRIEMETQREIDRQRRDMDRLRLDRELDRWQTDRR